MDRTLAEKIYAQGKEATLLALLELAAENKVLLDRIGELKKSLTEKADSPSTPSGMKPPYEKPSARGRRRKKPGRKKATPSGMKPPYEKPSARGRRRKKPGRKKGHPGARRAKIPEEQINKTKEHPLYACPDCNGPVTLLKETRERFTEDIPEEKPELTRHIQQVGYCKTCKKKVIAVVADALPGSTVGNRVTISHIVDIFNVHFHFPLSPGGLVLMWRRLAEILSAWYDEITRQANKSAYLHADETGWRVNGVPGMTKSLNRPTRVPTSTPTRPVGG